MSPDTEVWVNLSARQLSVLVEALDGAMTLWPASQLSEESELRDYFASFLDEPDDES